MLNKGDVISILVPLTYIVFPPIGPVQISFFFYCLLFKVHNTLGQRSQYLNQQVLLKEGPCKGPNVSTTHMTAMGCQQFLFLSVVQLKGKHCRSFIKPLKMTNSKCFFWGLKIASIIQPKVLSQKALLHKTLVHSDLYLHVLQPFSKKSRFKLRVYVNSCTVKGAKLSPLSQSCRFPSKGD